MNINQQTRMMTRSRVQPGHTFLSMESNPKQSKQVINQTPVAMVAQQKRTSDINAPPVGIQDRWSVEATPILEALWQEALSRKLTTPQSIDMMREYIKDGAFSLDYYIKMWSERLNLAYYLKSQPQNLSGWRDRLGKEKCSIEFSKARKLLNLDHYTIDEVLILLEYRRDGCNILRDDYIRSMYTIVMERGSIENKDIATIEMIIANIFSTFQTDHYIAQAPFKQVATALTLFCSGSREDKVRAGFDLFDEDPPSSSLHISSIKEYLLCVFTTLHRLSHELDSPLIPPPEELAQSCGEQIAYYPHEIGKGPYNSFISFDTLKDWYE